MRKFEVVNSQSLKHGQAENEVLIPVRSTQNAAGYDFFSPTDETIAPNKCAMIWTNIKAKMERDEVLFIYVRSSMGNQPINIGCGTGVIDADYYGNEKNDGNIGFKLYNWGETDFEIKKGDRIGQGVFQKFLVVDDEKVIAAKRLGGFGSTNKN